MFFLLCFASFSQELLGSEGKLKEGQVSIKVTRSCGITQAFALTLGCFSVERLFCYDGGILDQLLERIFVVFLGRLRCVLLGCWEGKSLLAGNSPAGTGEQATGRVDVPTRSSTLRQRQQQQAHRLGAMWRLKPGRCWFARSLVGRLHSRFFTLSLDVPWTVSSRKRLVSSLAPSAFSVMARFGVRAWDCDGSWWVGCWKALDQLRSSFRVSGFARRVAWMGAGPANLGAFVAWHQTRGQCCGYLQVCWWEGREGSSGREAEG